MYPEVAGSQGQGLEEIKAHCLACGSGFAVLAVEDASKSPGLSESQLPHLCREGGGDGLLSPF